MEQGKYVFDTSQEVIYSQQNYLSSLGDGEWEKKFEGLLSRFRAHGRSEEEVEKIVVKATEEVRNAKSPC